MSSSLRIVDRPSRTAAGSIGRPSFPGTCVAAALLAILPAVGLVSCKSDPAAPAAAAPVSQLSFASPEDAAIALQNATVTDDRPYLQELFGPELTELGSGDPAVDREEIAAFGRAMEVRREVVRRPDGSAAILIGRDSVEFPVPLVQHDGRWMFDTLAGVQTMEDMRVGWNELQTLRFLAALPAAQAEYMATDWDRDGIRTYSSRLRSTAGQRDGLWWPQPPGDVLSPSSPLGPYAAQGDISVALSETLGYNGYLFLLLTAQGPTAPGGAKSYLRNGKLVEGWAVVAFPAIYGQTGIMSFLMAADGRIYEQDLGDDTAAAARAITTYDPGAGWARSGGGGG